MKYKIEISGGFTGIPKFYEGERHLNEIQKEKLLDLLKTSDSKNSPIRDGQKYSFLFTEGQDIYAAEFGENNLPSELRQIMDSIIHAD